MNRRSLLLFAMTAPLVYKHAAAQDEEFEGAEEAPAEEAADQATGTGMRKYRCMVSDTVYDPDVGDEAAGVSAGTSFADLPDNWTCPDCGVPKSEFEPVYDE